MLTLSRFSPGAVCHTPTNDSGCGYGNGFRSTPSTTLKTAVLAPMPAVNVKSVTMVNAGVRQSLRRISRNSLKKEFTLSSENQAVEACELPHSVRTESIRQRFPNVCDLSPAREYRDRKVPSLGT